MDQKNASPQPDQAGGVPSTSLPGAKCVAGIDLGIALHNASTGIQVAEKDPQSAQWVVTPRRRHRIKAGQDERTCNTMIQQTVAGCSICVIDAPLSLLSVRDWENILIGCSCLPKPMKPSTTSAILSHAWRANSLVSEIRSQNANVGLYEIFPAAWFWLCDFDKNVPWKGKPSAANTARKIKVFNDCCQALRKKCGINITYQPGNCSNPNETDALPCVLCAILIAEKCQLAQQSHFLQTLDAAEPPVPFPPKMLWDSQLPQSVQNLGWTAFP